MQGKQERRIEEVPLLILFYFGRENRGKSRELFNAKNHRTLRWLQNMSSAIEKKYRTSIGFHFIAISYRFNLFCPPVVGWFKNPQPKSCLSIFPLGHTFDVHEEESQ